ncbi:energy-coupling factor transport system substrate-specific component [Flavimobilis soli]|uniref:Energy-coupling factor transport system substrate-specific component n=1 Tax=Flavimobilis soli TaxID=442709 RepID=A0A2A9EA86_9MICO|nr:ECF transporter S component [Flavimobilis soli]PFG35491.1 energy-coupling factor transport system substrate-specific component [Flavimobilis soli]
MSTPRTDLPGATADDAATTLPTLVPRDRRGLTLHETVLLAVLAVVFGFLYWAFVQAWYGLQIAMGPLGDLAQNVLAGSWIMVAPLAVYIVRKPGVGVVVEILAALVEVAFLGSPVGPMLLLVGFIQGATAELPFALTRYRHFGWPTFLASGVSAGVLTFAYNAFRQGWLGQEYLGLRFAFTLASCILLSAVAAKLLGDGLLRTGVLDNQAIGRAAR